MFKKKINLNVFFTLLCTFIVFIIEHPVLFTFNKGGKLKNEILSNVEGAPYKYSNLFSWHEYSVNSLAQRIKEDISKLINILTVFMILHSCSEIIYQYFWHYRAILLVLSFIFYCQAQFQFQSVPVELGVCFTFPCNNTNKNPHLISQLLLSRFWTNFKSR